MAEKGYYLRQFPFLTSNGVSPDAFYGPWASIAEFEKKLTEWHINKDYLPNGVTICIEDGTTKLITKYVRVNGSWRAEGAVDDSLSKESTNPVQNKVLSNILIFS